MQLTLELVQQKHRPNQIEIDGHHFVVQSAWLEKAGWQANIGLFRESCVCYQRVFFNAGKVTFEDSGEKRGKPEFVARFLKNQGQLVPFVEFCCGLH